MSVQDLIRGLTELGLSEDAYLKAQNYYEGRVGEFFASDQLRRRIAKTGSRYKFNLAKTPVRALANRVEVAAVSVPNNTAATAKIEQIWKANDLGNNAPNLHLRTFEYGDGYMMVWGVDEDETNPDLLAAGVRVCFKSPLNTRMLYDEEDPSKEAFTVSRWRETFLDGTKVWRVDLYYDDTIEPYWAEDKGADDKGLLTPSRWQAYHDPNATTDEWPQPHDEGQIPFFHFRNDMPYGVPEHVEAYGPQDAITKLLITQLTTADSYGVPERYTIAEAGADLNSNSDDPDWDDDEEAPAQAGTSTVSSSRRSGPGTVQDYYGKKTVGQFPQADPKALTDPVELYVGLMSQATETPLRFFKPGGQMPSGYSQEMSDEPFNNKVDARTRMLTATWRRLWRFALRLADVPLSDDQDITIMWKPPGIKLAKDFWDIAAQKEAMGIPRRQILLEAGYTAAQLDAFGITEATTPAPQANPNDDKEGNGED